MGVCETSNMPRQVSREDTKAMGKDVAICKARLPRVGASSPSTLFLPCLSSLLLSLKGGGRKESNPRPADLEPAALPLCYALRCNEALESKRKRTALPKCFDKPRIQSRCWMQMLPEMHTNKTLPLLQNALHVDL